MSDHIHRCTDRECPLVGQVTGKFCRCHVSERDMMLARIARLESLMRHVNEKCTGELGCRAFRLALDLDAPLQTTQPDLHDCTIDVPRKP